MVKSTKIFALILLTSIIVLMTLSPKHKCKSAGDPTILFLTSASVGGTTDPTGTQTCIDDRTVTMTTTLTNPAFGFGNCIIQSDSQSTAMISSMFDFDFSARKYLSKHTCAVGEACNNQGSTGEHMRRSLTVTPENDKKILLTKGRFLTGDKPLDIDYTTLVNIFIELGHKLISAAWTDSENPNVVIDKNEIIESFKKHAFNSELKEESVGDQVTEIIFRKLLEQSNITASEQIKENQMPELPPQESRTSGTKMQKYIA